MRQIDSTRTPTPASSDVLLLGAALLFSLAVRVSTPANITFIIPALALLWISTLRKAELMPDRSIPGQSLRFLCFLAALIIAGSAFWEIRLPLIGSARSTYWYLLASGLFVAVGALWIQSRRIRVASRIGVSIGVVAAAIAVALLIWLHQSPTIDVYHLHEAAASRLADGSSPYHGLEVASTSPFAEPGSTIGGYPYPPATLAWYLLGSWLGDPRFASGIAWILTLIVVSQGSQNGLLSNSGFVAFALLLAQPGWVGVLDQAWTEPFTLLLISAAVAYWQRLPLMSALLIGVAIASKQYMITALPAVLLVAHRGGRRRSLGVLVGGIIATLPVLADLSGAWESLVVFHIETPARTDSSNLVGLASILGFDYSTPTWIVLMVPSVLSMLVAHRLRKPQGLPMAIAVALSSFFLLASQAFANYWFLTYGIVVLAVCTAFPSLEPVISHPAGTKVVDTPRTEF